jgi:hypothetical protein
MGGLVCLINNHVGEEGANGIHTGRFRSLMTAISTRIGPGGTCTLTTWSHRGKEELNQRIDQQKPTLSSYERTDVWVGVLLTGQFGFGFLKYGCECSGVVHVPTMP